MERVANFDIKICKDFKKRILFYKVENNNIKCRKKHGKQKDKKSIKNFSF